MKKGGPYSKILPILRVRDLFPIFEPYFQFLMNCIQGGLIINLFNEFFHSEVIDSTFGSDTIA